MAARRSRTAQIVALADKGYENKQIAAQIGITTQAVSYHLRKMRYNRRDLRHRRILALLARGWSVTWVAKIMGLHKQTVYYHLNRDETEQS